MTIIEPPNHSDGNATMHPTHPTSEYTVTNLPSWLDRLGVDLSEARGQRDERAVLQKFPTGYALFRKQRKNSPYYIYALYGHPSGRKYVTTVDFSPHLRWLEKNDDTLCPCILCQKKQSIEKGEDSMRRKSISSEESMHAVTTKRKMLDEDDDQSILIKTEKSRDSRKSSPSSSSSSARIPENETPQGSNISASRRYDFAAEIAVNSAFGCSTYKPRGIYNLNIAPEATAPEKIGPMVTIGWSATDKNDQIRVSDVVNINIKFEAVQPAALIVAAKSTAVLNVWPDVNHINIFFKNVLSTSAQGNISITVTVRRSGGIIRLEFDDIDNVNISSCENADE